MHVNRNIGIGLGFIAVALILLIVVVNRRNRITPVAENTAPTEVVSTEAEPVDRENGIAYAIEDIPERSVLTPDMFEMRPLGPGVPTVGYITNPRSEANGQVTRSRILAGTPVRRDNLIGHISEVAISSMVRPGFRGMVVPVTTNPTLHDLVRIGDYVDIIAAFDGQESRTIVQNVRVLAVDVFVKDMPERISGAQRGAYKAPLGPRVDAAPAAGAPATRPQGEATATPGPPPAPTPTPPPSALPSPALTLEVTPAQATAISLAEAANAPLDFLLRPRENITVPEVRVAAITRPQLAPGAEAIKRRGAGTGTGGGAARPAPARPPVVNVATGGGGGGSTPPRLPDWNVPGPPRPGPTVGPIVIQQPQPETYGIPIYADGTLVRTDTVRKPD